jgi:hypothetical protein
MPLGVDDVDAAEEFYGRKLGLKNSLLCALRASAVRYPIFMKTNCAQDPAHGPGCQPRA